MSTPTWWSPTSRWASSSSPTPASWGAPPSRRPCSGWPASSVATTRRDRCAPCSTRACGSASPDPSLLAAIDALLASLGDGRWATLNLTVWELPDGTVRLTGSGPERTYGSRTAFLDALPDRPQPDRGRLDGVHRAARRVRALARRRGGAAAGDVRLGQDHPHRRAGAGGLGLRQRRGGRRSGGLAGRGDLPQAARARRRQPRGARDGRGRFTERAAARAAVRRRDHGGLGGAGRPRRAPPLRGRRHRLAVGTPGAAARPSSPSWSTPSTCDSWARPVSSPCASWPSRCPCSGWCTATSTRRWPRFARRRTAPGCRPWPPAWPARRASR